MIIITEFIFCPVKNPKNTFFQNSKVYPWIEQLVWTSFLNWIKQFVWTICYHIIIWTRTWQKYFQISSNLLHSLRFSVYYLYIWQYSKCRRVQNYCLYTKRIVFVWFLVIIRMLLTSKKWDLNMVNMIINFTLYTNFNLHYLKLELIAKKSQNKNYWWLN